MSDDQDDDDLPPRRAGKIGYGRPPKEHQFKKGQSGNPRGRPRRRRTAPAASPREIFFQEAMRLIEGHEKGKRVKIPVTQAAMRKLTQSAFAGDARTLLAFMKLLLSTSAGDDANRPSGTSNIQIFIPDNGRGSYREDPDDRQEDRRKDDEEDD